LRAASAPGKAILLGEHFVVHGTGALLCAIGRRVRVACSERAGGAVRVRSAYGDGVAAAPEAIASVPAHHRPIVQVAREAGGGLDVAVESDIPAGVGLGSSSACCVAAAGAILGVAAPGALAAALRAERTVFAGASGADTAACAAGGIIAFSGGSHEACEAPARASLVIASTGRAHTTADVVEAVRRRAGSDAARFGALCERVAGLVEDARAALRSGDLVSLGRHMAENQECLARIGVSDAGLDRLVRAASAPSYGAKLTGAGRGGCVIALVDASNAARTLGAVRAAGAEAFESEMGARGLGA